MKDSPTFQRLPMGAWVIVCSLVGLVWPSLSLAQPATTSWSWEFASSRVPGFEEKVEESTRWLVVEVLFRNNQTTDQQLIVAKEKFQAITEQGTPIEILGLLFRVQANEGAKRMRPVTRGGMIRMETLSEGQGQSATWFMHSPGPVEVVVAGGGTYKQRLLLIKPKESNPIRLKFDNLPELRVSLPG